MDSRGSLRPWVVSALLRPESHTAVTDEGFALHLVGFTFYQPSVHKGLKFVPAPDNVSQDRRGATLFVGKQLTISFTVFRHTDMTRVPYPTLPSRCSFTWPL